MIWDYDRVLLLLATTSRRIPGLSGAKIEMAGGQRVGDGARQ